MKDYAGILIDLDNTLYPYDPANEAGINAYLNFMEHKSGINKAEAKEAFDQARRRVHAQLAETAASHHRLFYFQRACEYLNLNPVSYVLDLYDCYWQSFFEHMQLFPWVIEFFERCQQLKKKICLVTDLIADIQFRKLIHLGLDKTFDYIITSEEAGCEKPHPAIFLLALEKMQMDKSQVVMIGDNFKKDIMGAHMTGIDALYFSPQGEICPHENHPTINFEKLVTLL